VVVLIEVGEEISSLFFILGSCKMEIEVGGVKTEKYGMVVRRKMYC